MLEIVILLRSEIGVQNGRDNLAVSIQNQPSFATLEPMDLFQNGGFKCLKCGNFGHKLEDSDKASTYISEVLFVEEEMVQYFDENVEQYCNNVPVFDKPASEEVMAIALMIVATYLTPKQDGEEIIGEDGEEHHGDGNALSLFPKMQDVYDVLPTMKI